ncbi:hypothetical protein V2G26_020802 [Clonostachys chloroleuca]
MVITSSMAPSVLKGRTIPAVLSSTQQPPPGVTIKRGRFSSHHAHQPSLSAHPPPPPGSQKEGRDPEMALSLVPASCLPSLDRRARSMPRRPGPLRLSLAVRTVSASPHNSLPHSHLETFKDMAAWTSRH